MARVNDRYPDWTGVRPGGASRRKLEHLARHDLPDGSAGSPRRTPEPAGDDHERIAVDAPKGIEVEVIRMGVRHEDGVDLADRTGIRRRADTTQGTKAGAQERIGQEAEAVHLDENRRVTEPGDPDGVAHAPVRVPAARGAGRGRRANRGASVGPAPAARE